MDNQNSYIVERQTTQWSKEKEQMGKQRSTKNCIKTKNQATPTPLKPGVNSVSPEELAVPSPLVESVVLK